MTQVFKNVSLAATFGFVFCMHVFFVLLLMAKPVLAEETEQEVTQVESTTTESVDKNAEKTQLKEKEFNFSINGEKGTIKVGKNGVQISHEESEDGEDGFAGVVSNIEKLNKASVWSDVLEDVLVPIVLFLCVFGFAGYAVYSKSRTRREYLETIKAFAQSGQPIPPELLNNMNAAVGGGKILAPGKTQYDANAIRGVKYIFFGIGFAGMMMLISEGHIGYAIGFLFITMGAFHIYTSQAMQKQKTTDTVATPTPDIK